ncbi:Signal peptidase I W [subsurface metagenome]
MKKAIQSFGFAVIILLMAAAAFTFLAPHFGWSVDTVFSGSMEPQLKVGGVVVTRPVEAGDIKIGDIITFHSPLNEKLTSHRVIAVEDGSPVHFQTKGDTNEDADPFVVPAQNVAGKVCFHVPYLGYAAQFVRSPLGLLLTLCLPGLIIIVMEMVSIWRVLTEVRIERRYRIR